MFGFTYMVWASFYEQFRGAGLDLSRGVLIHSGGWKKMVERSVDNATFRTALGDAFGLTNIHNFYGMVEQIGSIFLEGPGGLLYPPNFADVIVRDPETWEPAANGQPGVIQVLSLLPHSYPGHSLLTEDTGVIEAVDPGNGGWMGKGIRVLGRVARSELRGVQRRNRGGVMALVWSPKQPRDGRRLRAGRAHRSHDLFGARISPSISDRDARCAVAPPP